MNHKDPSASTKDAALRNFQNKINFPERLQQTDMHLYAEIINSNM